MKQTFLLAALFVLSACASGLPTDPAYLGKWFGPEGTYLEITESQAGYNIRIRDLDGVVGYHGVPTEDGIEFIRNGHPATIRTGTGAETGMKWLADKKTCLIVRDHEGYCRD